jgi:hypothetical protein
MITGRTKTLFIAWLLIFVGVLGSGGAAFYMVHLKESALEKYLDEQARLAASEKEAAVLLELAARTESVRAEIVGHVVSDDDSVIEFLSYMDALYGERGIVAETRPIVVESIKGNSTFEYLVLEVSINGTFETVATLLSIFENLPYQTDIRNVAFERTAEGWRASYRMYVTKYKTS